jgi:hypothetical protein
LQVPLVVWSPDHTTRREGDWGRTIPIASHDQFNQAVYTLSNTLDKQAVVWLEGLHLPQRLALSSNAADFTLIETAQDILGSPDEEPIRPKEAAAPAEPIFGDLPPMSSEELDRMRYLLSSIPESCTPSCRQVIRVFDELDWLPEGADIRFLAYVNKDDEFEVNRSVFVTTVSPVGNPRGRKFCVVVFSDKDYGFEARLSPVSRSATGGGGSPTSWGESAVRMQPLGEKGVGNQLWIGAAIFDSPPRPNVAVEIEAIRLVPPGE